MPRTGADQRMVEGGAEVDEHQGDSEDGATDDVPGCSARGGCDEVDRADERESGPNAVGDGIGDNIAQAEKSRRGLTRARERIPFLCDSASIRSRAWHRLVRAFLRKPPHFLRRWPGPRDRKST